MYQSLHSLSRDETVSHPDYCLGMRLGKNHGFITIACKISGYHRAAASYQAHAKFVPTSEVLGSGHGSKQPTT